MGKVKFIIESDFLKTNSIMKFAIGKGAKIEDYQQTITEAKKDGVREFLTRTRDHCRADKEDQLSVHKSSPVFGWAGLLLKINCGYIQMREKRNLAFEKHQKEINEIDNILNEALK